jgi:hypothetical protein
MIGATSFQTVGCAAANDGHATIAMKHNRRDPRFFPKTIVG